MFIAFMLFENLYRFLNVEVWVFLFAVSFAWIDRRSWSPANLQFLQFFPHVTSVFDPNVFLAYLLLRRPASVRCELRLLTSSVCVKWIHTLSLFCALMSVSQLCRVNKHSCCTSLIGTIGRVDVVYLYDMHIFLIHLIVSDLVTYSLKIHGTRAVCRCHWTSPCRKWHANVRFNYAASNRIVNVIVCKVICICIQCAATLNKCMDAEVCT